MVPLWAKINRFDESDATEWNITEHNSVCTGDKKQLINSVLGRPEEKA